MANEASIIIKDKAVKNMIKGLIKQTGKISQRAKDYVSLLGAIVLSDIDDHFQKERGPHGRWRPWSAAYRKRMMAQGKGGNKILQDTGRLRSGWLPNRYRTSKTGILWFNPVKYAGIHDRGSRTMPRRQFTWLSSRAIKKMETDTAKFLLR
jgi:phage gpG-like protein